MDSFSLADIYDSIWRKLDRAVHTGREPWHLLSLATIREERPEIRTVVLKGAEKAERLVWMHTDLRSPKHLDVHKNSEGALLFYDPRDCWQLRLNGTLSFDQNSESTEKAWQRIAPYGRRCYQGPEIPGTQSLEANSNLPSEPTEFELGRNNFSRLLFQVTKMDWLSLKASGHVRSQWQWDGKEFIGTWVAP